MAINKTIYFNDEMEKVFNLIADKTGMKAGQIIKESLSCYLVQIGIDAPTPKSEIEIRVKKLEDTIKEMINFCPQYAEHVVKGLV